MGREQMFLVLLISSLPPPPFPFILPLPPLPVAPGGVREPLGTIWRRRAPWVLLVENLPGFSLSTNPPAFHTPLYLQSISSPPFLQRGLGVSCRGSPLEIRFLSPFPFRPSTCPSFLLTEFPFVI